MILLNRILSGSVLTAAAVGVFGCSQDNGSTDPPEAEVAVVTVSPGTASLDALGMTQQFSAQALDQQSNVVSGKVFSWSSSDQSTATVDSDGLASSAGNGTATIRATTDGVAGTADLTVQQVIAAVQITPQSVSLSAGGTASLEAELSDANGNTVLGISPTWVSLDEAIATVNSSGLVTAIADGVTSVLASANGQADTATVTCSPAAPAVADVTVSPGTASLAAFGMTQQFSAQALDQQSNVIPGKVFSWASSNQTAATVDSDGLASSAGNGTTTISATTDGITGTAALSVQQQVAEVQVTPDAIVLSMGDTTSLGAELSDANGHAVLGSSPTWVSLDEAIATVNSSGLVTAIAEGVTSVLASANGHADTATVTCTSAAPAVADVTVSPGTASLAAFGMTQQFSAEALDQHSNVIAGKVFSWESSNQAAATVDSDGLASAVGNGTATIRATTDGITGTADLTVQQVVAEVQVTPQSVSLNVGNTTSLDAELSDANGNLILGTSPTWLSLDDAVATVSASGMVTAIAEGVTSVVASANGHADTATVTCTQQGTATVFFTETFEDTDFAARGWYDNTGLSITTDEYHSGERSLEVRFNQGASQPTFGGSARHLFAETESVYLSLWIKYGSNWVGSGDAYHPHEFYFVTNEDNQWVGPAYTFLTTYVEHNYQLGGIPYLRSQDGRNVDTDNLGVDLSNITEDRAVSGCNGETDGYATTCYSAGPGRYFNGKSWAPSQPYFVDDEWHFIEAYFELNAIQAGIGQTNGTVQYWFDGTLIIDHDDVLLRTGSHPTMAFNQFIVAPYIGSGSPVAQTMWVDDLTVATARP